VTGVPARPASVVGVTVGAFERVDGEGLGRVTADMPGSLESPAVHSETIHLRPTAELAERLLLPGDPGRALALAQLLMDKPLMFNHHRGLWGYTGRAADGELLTIQSTGMGGPSAAIVLHELVTLGARRAIRVGTCGALNGRLQLGQLLVANEAIAADGTSRALGAGERVAADPQLTEALEAAGASHSPSRVGGPPQTVVSTDLFYEPNPQREHDWRAAGAAAVEMEAATLFAVGAHLEVPVGCVLVVSDLLNESGRRRIDEAELVEAAEAMGQLALRALDG
jgi:uridine phosphorylase